MYPLQNMQCDCKAPINFSVQFPDYKMVDPKSHEYQFESFIYACVMLFNYFSLTTFIMIKFMLFKPSKQYSPLDVDESRKEKEDLLLQFREREKKANVEFEREARRHFKQQMINYLKNMQTLPGVYTGDTSDKNQQMEEKQRISESGVEEDDEVIWKTEYEWKRSYSRQWERKMAVSSVGSEFDEDSMTEYFL